MEGDVEYIQSRPTQSSFSSSPSTSSTPNPSPEADAALQREQDKWDAWHAHSGLSRTAAKKLYIETLITTMHTYASATPEARELVAELEFVWDQVRENSNPEASGGDSDRSSPLQAHGSYPGISSAMAAGEELGGGRKGGDHRRDRNQPMRMLSPVGQREEELDEEREEFVDAPAYSQIEGEDEDEDEDDQGGRAGGPHGGYEAAIEETTPERSHRRRRLSGDVGSSSTWRKRIEAAMVKMSTEVAALREQLESRNYIAQKRRRSWLGWVWRLSWFLVRAVVVDVFFLWLVILWLRRKKDRRLEGAVRVLLGDAVQKVGSNMKVPKLPSRKA